MKLIVNADDFGLTKGVNRGILSAFSDGIVRSATIMANQSAFIDAVEIAKENPRLGVGVHLTLTAGKPLTEPSTLLRNGMFLSRKELERTIGEIDTGEVEAEWSAQIKAVIDAGLNPTHIDSHHHVHNHKRLLPVAIKLALSFGLAMRAYDAALLESLCNGVVHTDALSVDFFGVNATMDNFKLVLEKHKGYGSLELMCHPGIADEELMRISSYNDNRQKELEILSSAEIKRLISKNEVELINYADLAHMN